MTTTPIQTTRGSDSGLPGRLASARPVAGWVGGYDGPGFLAPAALWTGPPEMVRRRRVGRGGVSDLGRQVGAAARQFALGLGRPGVLQAVYRGRLLELKGLRAER